MLHVERVLQEGIGSPNFQRLAGLAIEEVRKPGAAAYYERFGTHNEQLLRKQDEVITELRTNLDEVEDPTGRGSLTWGDPNGPTHTDIVIGTINIQYSSPERDASFYHSITEDGRVIRIVDAKRTGVGGIYRASYLSDKAIGKLADRIAA